MTTLPKVGIAASAVVLLLIVTTVSYNNDLQPPAARTGAPNEGTCGDANCHNNTPNSGAGNVSLTFSNPTLKYTPGDTFYITVKVSDNTKTKWGFEMTALNATNDSTPGKFLGEVSGILTSNPVSSSFNKRKYVAHRDANTTTSQWMIPWVAPASNIGNICFYVAGNAANNNGNNSGDNVYTASLCIAPETGVGIAAAEQGNSWLQLESIRYNQLVISYVKADRSLSRLALYDLQGRQIQILLNEEEGAGHHRHILQLPEALVEGIYLIRMFSGNEAYATKIYLKP